MQRLRGVKGHGSKKVTQKVGFLERDLQTVRGENIVKPNPEKGFECQAEG